MESAFQFSPMSLTISELLNSSETLNFSEPHNSSELMNLSEHSQKSSASHVDIAETLYQVVENTHIIYGLISNSLLLYAITKFTRKSLGIYKHLQQIFGAYDLFLVMMHALLKPRVMVVETTIFGVAADWDSRHITCFYCCCNTVPFVLMIIDFLYRYWSIGRPHLISLFRNKKFIAATMVFPIVEFSVWYYFGIEFLTGKGEEIGKTLLRAESKRRLGTEIHEGWLVMNYWENDEFHPRIFAALCVFNSIMIGCFSVAVILGMMTYYHIYVLGGHSISARALYMQRKLFVSVCFQTAIPLFFVYIPYICVLNLPFLHLPVFFWDDACMLLTSCFPAWDGAIVIILMPDYWNGLMGMICKTKPKDRESSGPVSIGQTKTISKSGPIKIAPN